MALAENLQRRDLDPFEEAEGLLKLTTDFGLTQAAAAELVGKTQAAVANKLRLLKLFPKTVEIIRREGLSERHGRALLALDEEARQVKGGRVYRQKAYDGGRRRKLYKIPYIAKGKAQKAGLYKGHTLFHKQRFKRRTEGAAGPALTPSASARKGRALCGW